MEIAKQEIREVRACAAGPGPQSLWDHYACTHLCRFAVPTSASHTSSGFFQSAGTNTLFTAFRCWHSLPYNDQGLEGRAVNISGVTPIELETQTHAVGIIIPPPDIRAIVDKTASFVARNGPEFEKRILGSEKNNAKFNFLLSTDPYNAYYKSKIAACQEEAAGGDAAAVAAKAEAAAKAAAAATGTAVVAGTGAAKPTVLVAPKKEEYSVHIPAGITSLDLDIIKLTAQFVARNGKSFLTGLTSREHTNPQFNFLKPTHSMFTFFTSLADAYSKVLMPPKGLSEGLKKDEDKSGLLERALQRLEWERSQEAAKKEAEDEAEAERTAMALIDWHDFVVVETIDFYDEEDEDLPAPLTMQEVIAQLRETEIGGTEGEGNGVVTVAPGDGEQEGRGDGAGAMDVEMDEDEIAMINEGATAAAQTSAGLSAPEPQMKIVRNYKKPEVIAAEARARAAGGSDAVKFAVSPITGELVAVNEMAEHMRISLIDPKWKVQKEAMLAKLRDSTMANDEEVATNVLMLARTRPDIFGSTDEEVSNAIVESIEAKREASTTGAVAAGGSAAVKESVLPQMPPPPPSAPVNLGGPQLKAFTPAAPVPPPPPPAKISAVPVIPPPPAPAPLGSRLPPPPPLAAPGPALKAAPSGMHAPISTPLGSAMRPLGAAEPPPRTETATPPELATQEDEHDGSEAPAKRQKVGDVELEPEKDFLSAHPGSGTIKVQLPAVDGVDNLDGQVVEVPVQSLAITLAEMKKLIKEAAGGLAANKQKISTPALGFLTDKHTLAYYNITLGSTLQLSVKERGGRKK